MLIRSISSKLQLKNLSAEPIFQMTQYRDYSVVYILMQLQKKA